MATPQQSNASSRKRRKKWRPNATAEARKLSNKESWNLPSGDDTSSIGLRATPRRRLELTPRSNDRCSRLVAGGDRDGDSSTVSSLTDGSTTTVKIAVWGPCIEDTKVAQCSSLKDPKILVLSTYNEVFCWPNNNNDVSTVRAITILSIVRKQQQQRTDSQLQREPQADAIPVRRLPYYL